MGHKVHPNGFRLGVYRNWEAKWFAPDKEFKPLLLEDVRLRRMLMIRLKNAGLARIETEVRRAGISVLRLETGDLQIAAMRLYVRMGFRECPAFGAYAMMAPQSIASSVFFEKRIGT